MCNNVGNIQLFSRFPVHRHIIIKSSDFFKPLLANENSLVHLDTDGPTLERIIHFIYIGCIALASNNIENVFLAASTMKIKSLVNLCERFLEENLASENCLKVLLLLDRCGIESGPLKRNALSLVCSHFPMVSTTPEIMQICGNTLIEIFKCDSLSGRASDIFECLVKWAQQDCPKRAKFMPEFLELIQLAKIPSEVRGETVVWDSINICLMPINV